MSSEMKFCTRAHLFAGQTPVNNKFSTNYVLRVKVIKNLLSGTVEYSIGWKCLWVRALSDYIDLLYFNEIDTKIRADQPEKGLDSSFS